MNIFRNKPQLLYAGAGLLTVIVISTGILLKGGSVDANATRQVASLINMVSIPTETIRGGDAGGVDQVGSSWPGEIISSGDVEVQPQREGTIVEWKVKIGQKVYQGQVLARLSAPPATPELTRALAEQAQSLTRARVTAEAQAIFVEKNKKQLNDLRAQIVTIGSLDVVRRDVEIKFQIVYGYSTQTIRKAFLVFTNYSADPITGYKQYPQNFYFNLRRGLGDTNGNTQADFMRDLTEAVRATVGSGDDIGEKTMKFLQSADALVANSPSIDGSVEGLVLLRTMVSSERAELSEKITELSEARAEARSVERETAEKLKDIDEKLIDLDRQLQLARAESEGAGVAYYTISNALTGGLGITAPRSGIVSTILKKNGDFVNPGTTVASINSVIFSESSARSLDTIVRNSTNPSTDPSIEGLLATKASALCKNFIVFSPISSPLPTVALTASVRSRMKSAWVLPLVSPKPRLKLK